jgi:hypothetical protein
MHLWGAAPIAVGILIGGAGAHPASLQNVAHRAVARSSAGRESASPAVRTTAAVVRAMPGTAPAIAPVSTTAVLAMVSPHKWRTTILVKAVGQDCPNKGAYSLEISPPSPSGPPVVATGIKNTRLNGSSPCTATVTFNHVRALPADAVLVVGKAGGSIVQLTLSRNVTWIYYLLIPALAGLLMVLILWRLIVTKVALYDWENRLIRPFRRSSWRFNQKFWSYSVSASGAWTVSDSWATNLVTGFAVLATILGAATTAGALFPGVATDSFTILIVIAGGIAAASPLLFGILYARWTARNPGVTPDATVRLRGVMQPGQVPPGHVPPGQAPPGQVPRARLRVPAGAAITSPGSAHIRTLDGAGLAADVKAGASIQAPAGCWLYFLSAEHAAIALPGGADVVVPGECGLVIAGGPGTLTMAAADATAVAHAAAPAAAADAAAGPAPAHAAAPAPAHAAAAPAKHMLRVIRRGRVLAIIEDAEPPAAQARPAGQDVRLPLPVLLTAPAGAKITVLGSADLLLPAGTQVTAPRRNEEVEVDTPPADRHIELPQGTNTLVGNMRLVTISALMTIFGVGAEIGIVGVLAVILSNASTPGRWLIGVLLGFVAVFALWYSKTAIEALANPQPGSSLSGSAGTSFTL